ncbi:MAG: hypothetical protein CL931_09995 [Deltaproteobacteria bacterium]|nr:hypothetical protein [Deltaproteobacteria bacterium]
MIYAIAAYSITLGVLGLYWAVLAHRRVEIEAAHARAAGEALADPRKGFNAGALLLAPFWMLKHGMTIPGALLLVPTIAIVPLAQREMWIPLLFVGTVPFAAGAALSFVGNRIAVAHTGLEAPDAYSASQLPWTLAGIALYTIVLPWAWYFTQA